MPETNFWTRSPDTHLAHQLHAPQRNFQETNCAIDVWIELLQSLELDPHAFLSVTLASDFEGDQWTFFKPSHADLQELYGISVEELTVWRPLAEHVRTQLDRGNMPLVEVDAFYLPDTAGSDYRRQHTKTSVAMQRLDSEACELHYFHNTGFYRLAGDDYRGIFRLGSERPADELPTFAELIKLGRLQRRAAPDLKQLSLMQARRHFARRPPLNPLTLHGQHIAADIERWVTRDLATYHAYSFASLRQLGACYELAADYLRWLDSTPDGPTFRAAERFAAIAATAKMLILKLARMANTRRVADLTGNFAEMAQAWDDGMGLLQVPLG